MGRRVFTPPLRLALLLCYALCGTVLSDRWTLHDPDFAVSVALAPYADRQWNATQAEREASEPARGGTLAIPSSVLNLTVALPAIENVTTTEVHVTLYRKRNLRTPTATSTPSRDIEDADEDGVNDRAEYVVLADTHVQYAKSYRLDVGPRAQELAMRVYVESQLSSGRTMRALFVRPIDLSPSEPFMMQCADTGEKDVALHITSFPPTNVPMELCQAYTMDGRVPLRKWYFDDQTDAERTYEERSFEFVEDLIEKARDRKRYYYGLTDDYLYAAMDKYPIRGKHVLIVGSTIPWYEAICIAMEAASCTTIDYNKLRYNHPKIHTFTVSEFENTATRKQFDMIFSISSFEHDGLGRYGDPLDPDADLKAMQDLRKYTKETTGDESTNVFLVVPVGADVVVWNAQRIYGPLRLPLLLKDWSLVESFGFAKSDFSAPFTVGHQPLFVLESNADRKSAESDHSEL